MKRLLTLAAVGSAALLASACVTVIGVEDEGYSWTGEGAQPFDSARDACEDRAGDDEGSTAFVTCMADKGWTRVKD